MIIPRTVLPAVSSCINQSGPPPSVASHVPANGVRAPAVSLMTIVSVGSKPLVRKMIPGMSPIQEASGARCGFWKNCCTIAP